MSAKKNQQDAVNKAYFLIRNIYHFVFLRKCFISWFRGRFTDNRSIAMVNSSIYLNATSIYSGSILSLLYFFFLVPLFTFLEKCGMNTCFRAKRKQKKRKTRTRKKNKKNSKQMCDARLVWCRFLITHSVHKTDT